MIYEMELKLFYKDYLFIGAILFSIIVDN